MKALIPALLLAFSSVPTQAGVRLGEETRFVFADLSQARQVLTNRDDFIQRLSAFDRAVRMKSAEEVSEQMFLEFVTANALEFSEAEEAAVEKSLGVLKPALDSLKLPWPETILLIKTTGREEADAAYTRANAIILPAAQLRPQAMDSLERFLCHELFHVLSRHQPDLKEKLYEAIGFHKCAEIPFPTNLVRITNPDAPKNDHWIEVTSGGQTVRVIPILFASPSQYEAARGGDLFDYLTFKLLVVQKSGREDAVGYDLEKPTLLDADKVEGYFEQIGRNTSYIIHPEEVLAENFVLLVRKRGRVNSPEVLAKMEKVLSGFSANKAAR